MHSLVLPINNYMFTQLYLLCIPLFLAIMSSLGPVYDMLLLPTLQMVSRPPFTVEISKDGGRTVAIQCIFPQAEEMAEGEAQQYGERGRSP